MTKFEKSSVANVSANISGVIEGFQRDVFKILHSKAFSRYADKTQVVYLLENDHITHRILHVQLVSHLARLIGRKLNLNVDLIEAISLGHDLGHCPFGHEGEKYLSMIAQENGLGCFSHALQSCRLTSLIEPLDLQFETLDGFLCHDGGMRSRLASIQTDKTWEKHLEERVLRQKDPEADLKPKTIEAAVVKVSDTASYLVRDIVDAIRLQIIKASELPKTILGQTSSDMLETIASDIISTFYNEGEIGFSTEVFEAMKLLRKFNFDKIYWHEKLKTESQKIERAFKLLFTEILDDWKLKGRKGHSILWDYFLHSKRQEYIDSNSDKQFVIDYIAGMTDGYFLRLYRDRFFPRDIEVPHVMPFS